jgi:protein-disulfide isomerase
MKKPLLAILILLTAALLAGNGATLYGAGHGVGNSAGPATVQKAAKAEAFTLPPRASGSKDAPIVMEVYSDFECPHCKELYLRTLRRVMDDYCASGKVYLIHRDFPLPQHAHAREASHWAVAAATIGKYEPVAEALFSTQDTWVASGNIEAVVAGVLSPADLQKVKQSMSAHKAEIEAAIEADVFLGHEINITQTPTTKIAQHGATLSISPGNFPYATLKTYLDSQLAN